LKQIPDSGFERYQDRFPNKEEDKKFANQGTGFMKKGFSDFE